MQKNVWWWVFFPFPPFLQFRLLICEAKRLDWVNVGALVPSFIVSITMLRINILRPTLSIPLFHQATFNTRGLRQGGGALWCFPNFKKSLRTIKKGRKGGILFKPPLPLLFFVFMFQKSVVFIILSWLVLCNTLRKITVLFSFTCYGSNSMSVLRFSVRTNTH